MDAEIVVLDDFFPHQGSSFRFEEFCSYLDALPEIAIYSSGAALLHADEIRPIDEVIDEHIDACPTHAGRVRALTKIKFPKARLYYAVFLHVVAEHIDAIEAAGGSLVFTLYPGGGFALDQHECQVFLARVFGSPCFRHVIVTQAPIRDYLVGRGFCRDDQVTMIYGGVCPRALFAAPPAKRRYSFDKPTLDLCFVANRYTPTGSDKGYDLLVDAAQRLVECTSELRIHVVGRFDATILDLGAATSIFRFYGLQPSTFFKHFYTSVDAIVSPTRFSVLYPGAFDGFPTGCSVEAGMNEVAIVCTDPLGLNVSFVPDRDLVVVPPCVDSLVETVQAFLRNPEHLADLGRAIRRCMLPLFGFDRQMTPRVELLRRHAVAER